MTSERGLQAIEFSRYRVFDQRQTLQLKPLTLLFGRNSSGKSAALRLLPILAAAAQRARQGADDCVFDYASPALREAVFQDLVHNRQISGGLQIALDWGDCKFDATLHDLGAGGEVVRQFAAMVNGRTYTGNLLDEERDNYDVVADGSPSIWKLAGLVPVVADTEDGQDATSILRERLLEFAASVHWLGAVRASVPRVFELRPGAGNRIRPDGTGAAQAIRLSAAAGDGAADAVSRWLDKTCQCTLSFATSDEAIAFSRRFYPFNVITGSGSGRSIAVRDVGEGIAQALPVVMLCHQARLNQLGPNPILAFEQPELHLHPAAAVHLADEIVDCIAQASPACHLIETHSESMLLSVQIAIVQKKIRPEDVVVYWISTGDGSTSLRPITFDNEGFADGGWPQGIFRETLEQARLLAALRIDAATS